ncbi:MAG TPA: GGDEF domain-containing protein [Burkholderiaceae bacterium]
MLGLAYCWSGDHERADAALEAAVGIARRCNPGIGPYQLRVDQMWVEASRLFEERYHTGSMTDLTRFRELACECRQLELAGLGLCVMPSLQDMHRAVSAATCALLEIWDGHPEAARRGTETARRSLTGAVTWLDALVSWCEAEQAWSEQDWPKAEQAVAQMLETALAVEHEQLACRAHLLLIQVYEPQGKLEDVMRAQRALRRRERRVAAEGLGSREAIVTWQLGVRRSEQHLRGALVQSRQFERWSLEDTLTGIANRRCFQQALEECLRSPLAAARPLTVALLDVDKFKAINDTHSHRVGDRVLQALATLMANNVRQQDLPARWAGDEFVILFQDASFAVAQQICGRIQTAIAEFDWEAIAPGLRMTVSIGLSQAQPGDTAESLLHRSDKSMYSTKLRHRKQPPADDGSTVSTQP